MPVEPPHAVSAIPSAVPLLQSDGQPAWDLITFEVRCSKCDYNLRMLTQSRCPECGLEFHWPDVLERSQNRSAFLFEHWWRQRPFSSLGRTLYATLRPRRFWSSVSIHDRIHPRPLIFLILLAPFLFLLTLHPLAWSIGTVLKAVAPGTSRPRPAANDLDLADLAEILLAVAGSLKDGGKPTLQVALFLSVAFVAGSGLLCALRQTLGRCRIRSVQILRVTAYTAPVLFCWFAVAFLATTMLSLSAGGLMVDLPLFLQVVIGLLLGCAPMLACYIFFVVPALRLYLRLPQPHCITLTCGFVGFLTALTAFIFVSVLQAGGW